MRDISLTKGFVAIIDDDDFYLVSQYKWFITSTKGTNYAASDNRRKGGKYIYMHRLILNADEIYEVDHINHNGLDNRKENLRLVSHRENLMNRRKKNKTGYSGVVESNGRYLARIRINGEKIYLGMFDTAYNAHLAYLSKIESLKIERI